MAVDFATTSNMFTVGSTPTVVQSASNSLAYPSGNPMFAAWHSTNQAQNTTIVFDQVLANIGSGYNVANGIYTCPVAGIYHFKAQILCNLTVGDWRLYLVAAGKQQRQTIAYQGTTGSYLNLSCEGIYNMAAGDTIYALFTGPANFVNATTTNHFVGHMVT